MASSYAECPCSGTTPRVQVFHHRLKYIVPSLISNRWFDMQKVFIVAGIIILVMGLLWPWLGKIPLGRLPGDIIIDRPNLKVYFPITTMILISVVISLLLWFFRR